MVHPAWFEPVVFTVLGLLLLADLAIVARHPRIPSIGEASLWVGLYIGLALVFAGVLLMADGPHIAGQFVAGWLTEYSLSVDNLFVFMVIMGRFSVPKEYQQKVLMMGILLSLALRGGFILLGAAAISRFSWVFYLFGGFLVYSAWQLIRGSDQDEAEYRDNALVRRASRVLPLSVEYDEGRLRTGAPGKRVFTPMVIVFLAIGSTDLMFAFDSIPAVFGLTKHPFVVFTSTLFALMGLRQLYFLLGGLLERLVYLSVGLSVVLGFIGVKLVLEALHSNELSFVNGGDPVEWAPVIPVGVSLAVIVGVLVITAALSLVRGRGDAGGQVA